MGNLPRKPRMEYSGAIYPVLSRANGTKVIFMARSVPALVRLVPSMRLRGRLSPQWLNYIAIRGVVERRSLFLIKPCSHGKRTHKSIGSERQRAAPARC